MLVLHAAWVADRAASGHDKIECTVRELPLKQAVARAD